MFLNVTNALAMTEDVHQQIQGNALLIGNYLFELDKNPNSFNLDSFITSVRSIPNGDENQVYYKDATGKWYELVSDSAMNSAVAIDRIDNAITVRNGVAENTDPTVLAKSDLLISPAAIVESTKTPGTFDTEVTVTIKASNNAKFAGNIGGGVDAIASASLVRTAPAGTNMQITRVNDKTIKLKLTGTASSHAPSINTTSGSADHQKDFNKNGTYGDIKFLMLPAFFTGVRTVAEGGQYVVLDVQYNDGVVDTNPILDTTKSQMLTIESVDYGVIVLKSGSISDYNMTLNNVAITPSKVNDSGSVVKFEMNRDEVAVVKVTSKTDSTKTATISLGNGTKAFTAPIGKKSPDRILVSGKVSYSDYHLINYDADGNVRTDIKKTTFDTENEGVTPQDTSVPTLTVEKPRTPISENVVVKVTEPGALLSKRWLSNVYTVLKDYGTGHATRVPVQFTVDAAAGKVTILSNSKALDDRNGKHKVIIKSNGFNDVAVDFELIKAAGDLNLSPNFNWWADNELLFELADFNYAVTNPIHEVWLDGEKLDRDAEDYHVVSNLVRLENETVKKLTLGKHNLIIKVHGYEDYTRTFTLEQAPQGASNPTYGKKKSDSETSASVDAVSAASGSISIGSGSGSGSSSGSASIGSIQATVIFDFDHISNAFILTGLGMNTPYCDRTINWWKSFTKRAVIKDGSPVLVEYSHYKSKVGINGIYKTFHALHATMPKENPTPADYMNPSYKKPKGLFLDTPYSVKNMLQDAKMGERYAYSEVSAKDAPTLTATSNRVTYGQDVVITYSGDNASGWEEALTSIKINHTYLVYEINKNTNTITLRDAKNSFVTGRNTITFTADGFKTNTVTVDIFKPDQGALTVEKDSSNNVVISGLDAAFIQNKKTISVNNRGLYTDSEYGGDKGHYLVVNNQIVIKAAMFGAGKDQFDPTAQLTFRMTAEGYSPVQKNFVVNNLSGGTVAPSDVPDYVALRGDNSYKTGQAVKVQVAQAGVGGDLYEKALQEVYVDGKKLTSNQYKTDAAYNVVIDGTVFGAEKAYTIKLVATNYKEKELSVTISNALAEVPAYVTFEQNGQSVAMGSQLVLNFNDGGVSPSDYANAVQKVLIGSTEHTVTGGTKTLDITAKVALGSNTITIKAADYVDKVFTVTVTEATAPAKLVIDDKKVSETARTLDAPAAVAIYLGGNDLYKDAVTEIKIGDRVLTKDTDYTLGKAGVDSLMANVATLKQSNFTHGKSHTVTIKATGYSDATFTVVVKAQAVAKDVPDSVKLMEGNNEIDGDTLTVTSLSAPIRIAFDNSGFSSKGGAYEVALEGESGAYVVDGTSHSTTETSVQQVTIDGSYKRVLSIDASSVTKKEFTLVLKAEGYKDKTFTIKIGEVPKKAVPSFVGIYKGYKQVIHSKEIDKGDYVDLTIDGGFGVSDDYQNAITAIEIKPTGGATTTKTKAELKYNGGLRVQSNLLALGDNQITIKASGYTDYVCAVKVNKASVPSHVVAWDKDKGWSGGAFDSKTVNLPSGKELILIMSSGSKKTYKDSITAIKVDGTSVTDYTEDTYDYGSKVGYTIPTKYFTKGVEATVIIEADGYDNAEFKVTMN